MFRRIFSLLFLVSGVCLMSCEKAEKPVTLPPKGDGTVLQVDMGEAYEYQFFINLETESVVHTSRVDIWDLAFQCGSGQKGVFLNGGKGMAAYNTHKTSFALAGAADTLVAKDHWKYDAPNGSTDSSAIGDWTVSKDVYLVKLNESGSQIRKIQILSSDAFEYVILVGDLNSSVGVQLNVTKDATRNFVYFDFSKLSAVSGIEPAKDQWDLQMTRYHYTFYDQNPALQYIVNGALLNPNETLAYKDSLNSFASIDLAFAQARVLSADRDVIGFNWKTYNIDKGIYTIVGKYNYIIRNRNNHYFKLHFLDYYSSTGVKGSPKFESTPLN